MYTLHNVQDASMQIKKSGPQVQNQSVNLYPRFRLVKQVQQRISIPTIAGDADTAGEELQVMLLVAHPSFKSKRSNPTPMLTVRTWLLSSSFCSITLKFESSIPSKVQEPKSRAELLDMTCAHGKPTKPVSNSITVLSRANSSTGVSFIRWRSSSLFLSIIWKYTWIFFRALPLDSIASLVNLWYVLSLLNSEFSADIWLSTRELNSDFAVSITDLSAEYFVFVSCQCKWWRENSNS